MNELTAREKGDVYREKRSFYLASAEVRGKGTAHLFHLDTAGFVLEELEQVQAKPYLSLTGDEFADRPPTSAGQRAFAISVAEMKKTKDAFENGLQAPDNVKEALKRTISCFFAACGMDEDGNELRDRQSMKAGKDGFFESREEYFAAVRSEIAQRQRRFIDTFRKEKGLEEIDCPNSIEEDPALCTLIEKHPKEAKEHEADIARLREASSAAGREAAGLKSRTDALFSEVKKVYFDEALDWDYRKDLREAFLFSAFEADEKIRELLYTKEAAAYQLKWLLCHEPVDEVICEKIKEKFDAEPDLLDPKSHLIDLPGYVSPDFDIRYPVPEAGDMDQVFQRADEVKQYLNLHPEQFEAQCLLFATTLSEEFFDCIAKAVSLTLGADRISASDDFASLDKENKIRLFFVWVMADAVCRTGFTMIDFLSEYETRTVRKATNAFRRILPHICFSRVQKERKESLGVIMMERSGFHVSEQKDRLLEYFRL